MVQSPFDARKGEFAPRYLTPRKQPDFEAFGTRRKNRLLDFCAIHQMHLAYVRHGIDREQTVDDDVGAGFLARFAAGALLRRFMFFQKSGRQGPVVLSWFDGAATQQNVFAMHHDGTHDDLRIGIVDVTALSADVAFGCVSQWHTPNEM